MTQESSADPYRWLEDLDAPEAAAWVRERNAHSLSTLTGGEQFAALRTRLREVLDSADRIPYPHWHGDHLYNLWTDAQRPRGLWRRTTLEQYRRPAPAWQVLLDLDELAAREGETWVFQGAEYLRPGGDRALVFLSRGGADARVVREFDLSTGDFVAGGFVLPEAKSEISWIDRDTVYVGTDFGPASLTSAGYARQVRRWRRGQPLAEAELVYQAEPGDMIAYGVHDPTPGFRRDLLCRRIDFYRSEVYLAAGDGRLVRVEVPEDAEIGLHREWLLIELRSAWPVAGRTLPAGALLGTGFDAFLAGERDLSVLFEPQARTSLRYYAWTQGHLILATLRDVRGGLEVCTPGPGGWHREPLWPQVAAAPAAPTVGATMTSATVGAAAAAGAVPLGGRLGRDDEFRQLDVAASNPDHGEEYLLSSTGFLRPGNLVYGTVGGGSEVLKEEPAFFDAQGMSVRQYFATSADGTRVPYFVVGSVPPGSPPPPTLLTGYGGFEISRLPSYSGILGRGWLARGGTYVLANIRGGGEYGPDWHRAALRERRPRAYEDFAAVAGDLVDRGVTTHRRLGAEGGSNGGLLTGVMLTRYPHLFGAVVSQVPLLDMRRYHELHAGASWVAEYGDPDDPADWAYLSAFSPYHNVHSGQEYPPSLFVTSTRDDRVHPGHARKMVARLREYGADVTYYENVEGGHGAAADNEQQAFRWALVLEFLWRTLGGG
jgi:prolyl oligopeptidase